jgi:hypothetical protein
MVVSRIRWAVHVERISKINSRGIFVGRSEENKSFERYGR